MTRNQLKWQELEPCKIYEEVICGEVFYKMYVWYLKFNENLNFIYYDNILKEIKKYVKWKETDLKIKQINQFYELIKQKDFSKYVKNNFLRIDFKKTKQENLFIGNLDLVWISDYIIWLKKWLINNIMKKEVINVFNWGTPKENRLNLWKYKWKRLIKFNIGWSLWYCLINENKKITLWTYDKVRKIENWVNWDKVFWAKIWDKEMYISMKTWKPIWWEYDKVRKIEDWVNWDKVFWAKIWDKEMYVLLNTWKPIWWEYDEIWDIEEWLNWNKVFIAKKWKECVYVSMSTWKETPI